MHARRIYFEGDCAKAAGDDPWQGVECSGNDLSVSGQGGHGPCGLEVSRAVFTAGGLAYNEIVKIILRGRVLEREGLAADRAAKL